MLTPGSELFRALREEHDRLAALVAGLGPEDLTRRSGAREWTVAQVLSHLGSGSVINLAALDAALGLSAQPPADFNQQVWARWDALEPAEQAAEFVTAQAALIERYESLDAAEAEAVRVAFSPTAPPMALEAAARMRLNEVALHSWDVRVGFHSDATVFPASVALLLDFVPTLVGRVSKPERFEAAPAAVAVRTTAPEQVFTLVIGEKASVDFDAPASGESALALPAESWLRLVTGRLGPEYTPATVVSTGPVGLDRLRAVFPGY